MNKPLISIVVPVYNTEKYLRKCIESLANQTYENIEIVLVDDGSSDKSPEICDEYAESDMRIIAYHQENKGQSSARNMGISYSNGQYIVFVDSDDYCYPDMCEVLFENMYKYNVDLVIGERFLETTFKQPNNNNNLTLLSQSDCFRILIDGDIAAGPCVKLYKTNIIASNKVTFDEKIRAGEDLLFNSEYFVFVKNAVHVEKWLYHRSYNNDSIMHSSETQNYSTVLLAMDKLETIYNKYAPQDVYKVKLAKISQCLFLTGRLLNSGQKNTAKQYLDFAKEYYKKLAGIRYRYKIKTMLKLRMFNFYNIYKSIKMHLLSKKVEKL